MSDNSKKGMTRRDLLMMVGRAGGTAALLQAAGIFGLAPTVAQAAPVELKPLTGKKRTVLILGAGISGLVAAYELGKAGFNCKVLEASHRAGGRNLTVRHGDFIDELGNPHYCKFDNEPHLFFNMGPARIPAHHTGILHYCRTLGVDLELFTNYNKNCYAHDTEAFGGKPIRIREFEADLRGFIAELLAKAAKSDDFLDTPFNEVEAEKILAFAKSHGDLNDDFTYTGTGRAGYKSGGFISPGELKTPHAFKDIMQSRFWSRGMLTTESYTQAPSVVTPVGGMDKIVSAFMSKVSDKVLLKAQVKKINLLPDGVEVSYFHEGTIKTERADYCLNCIPAQLMPGIENNFPEDYAEIFPQFNRGNLSKVAVQVKERFWENDLIYSGITSTTQGIAQIWYPGHGIFKQKGILLTAYTGGPFGQQLAAVQNEQRIAMTMAQVDNIHPGASSYVENGVSVCWHKMNHILGCGISLRGAGRDEKFKKIQAPAGRHYMMGDQISYLGSWQEGAVRSAWWALEDIQRRETGKVAS